MESWCARGHASGVTVASSAFTQETFLTAAVNSTDQILKDLARLDWTSDNLPALLPVLRQQIDRIAGQFAQRNGDTSPEAVRSLELSAAIQRLEWVFENDTPSESTPR